MAYLAVVKGGDLAVANMDSRTRAGRRYRDLVASYTRDLGGKLSEAQLAQVRQLAGVTIQAENMQAAIVRGDDVDPDQVVRVSNLLARLLAALGPMKAAGPAPARTLADKLKEHGER